MGGEDYLRKKKQKPIGRKEKREWEGIDREGTREREIKKSKIRFLTDCNNGLVVHPQCQ